MRHHSAQRVARPTDKQVRALALFTVRVINSALLNDYADDEDGEMLIATAGECGLFETIGDLAIVDTPDWLLEAAGHT